MYFHHGEQLEYLNGISVNDISMFNLSASAAIMSNCLFPEESSMFNGR